MTSSSLRAVALGLALVGASMHLSVHAALGALHVAPVSAANSPGTMPSAAQVAQRSVAVMPRYTVHATQQPDGSRVQELVAGNGVVFAVRWNTLYKPDLSALLGNSFPAYADAARRAAQRGGIQRQFRLDATDLVVHSTGHLHTFAGYAYVRSLLPFGVTPQTLGWE